MIHYSLNWTRASQNLDDALYYLEILKIMMKKIKHHAIITETEKRILQILSVEEPLSVDEVIYRLHGTKVPMRRLYCYNWSLKGLRDRMTFADTCGL